MSTSKFVLPKWKYTSRWPKGRCWGGGKGMCSALIEWGDTSFHPWVASTWADFADCGVDSVGRNWHSHCHQLRGPLKQARSYLSRISFSLLIDCTHVESTLHKKTLSLPRISFSLLLTTPMWDQHCSGKHYLLRMSYSLLLTAPMWDQHCTGRHYPPRISYCLLMTASTLLRTRFFSKPPSFFFGRALWAQHSSVRNTYTSATDGITWSHDLAGRIEDQNLQERRKDETLAWTWV